MPIHLEELDSSSREEETTIILGRDILLKIIENVQSKSLIDEEAVKQLLSAKDLCYHELREPIDELIRKEEVFSQRIAWPATSDWSKVVTDLSDPAWTRFYNRFSQLTEYFFRALELDSEMESWQEAMQKKLDGLSTPQREEFASQFFSILLGKANAKETAEMDKELVSLDKEVKSRIGFGILAPSNLLMCPKCGLLLSTEEFATVKSCMICQKEVRREEVTRLFIHRVPNSIRKFWNSGLWLEAYFARLLRKLDFKTWVGINVMGASGILHEIDVLAIREGTVLVCECKSGKVSRNDVFNFCTKAGDLKAHVSILALIQELPESETRAFIKKNPAIIRIENMDQKREDEILSDLRQRLTLKA